jgi:hypothetical protein
VTDAPAIQIQRIASQKVRVPIIGTTPLIVHNWDDKARRQMLDKMQGRRAPKAVRDPQADYEASLYRTATGYGFPVLAFKAATVGAARFFGKDVKMTELRQFLFMHGVPSADGKQILTAIDGEPKMTGRPELHAHRGHRAGRVRPGVGRPAGRAGVEAAAAPVPAPDGVPRRGAPGPRRGGVITVARITPLADPSPWVHVAHHGGGALITAALFCAAILALGRGLLALLRFIDRLASSPSLIDRVVSEEAPRPGDGSA